MDIRPKTSAIRKPSSDSTGDKVKECKALIKNLSNLGVISKKSNLKLAEQHSDRDVCFSVQEGVKVEIISR